VSAFEACVDTGVLAKLYVREAESREASALVRRLAAPLPLSPLHRSELWNALHLKVFRSEATLPGIRRTLRLLEGDVEAGLWVTPTVHADEVFAEAVVLSEAHAARLGTRAPDVLHVTFARRYGVRRFVTTDVRKGRLAAAVGLEVLGLPQPSKG
jgi:predicted nucleic acid-binding protein